MKALFRATASLALATSGCGGDGSSPPPTSVVPAPTPTSAPTPTPTPNPTAAPTSTDPVLATLLSIATSREDFEASQSYAARSLIDYNGVLYFAFADHTPHSATPDADPAHFERLGLIPNQKLVLSDDFTDRAGPLSGRTVASLKWAVSGPAFTTAVVDSDRGYATADGNAYFIVQDIPGKFSEFSLVYFRDAPAGAFAQATTAFSTNNFPGTGLVMWHANWSSTGVADIGIWKNNQAALDPQNRFVWRTDVKLNAGQQYRLMVRPRGTFSFGYVDGAPAFITISDDNRIAADAKSFYVQNHVNGLGGEQQRYVELFVAD